MMQTLKKPLLLLAIIICMLRSGAQTIDSVEVSGEVGWKPYTTGISSYPEELRIISDNVQVLTSIDNFGHYKIKLPPGSYSLMPSKHYLWIEDEYIRLNDTISKLDINIPLAKKFSMPILELDTLALPNRLPQEGITHHFTEEKARLLDIYIKEQMAHYEIPGASLAIIKGGKVIYKQTYGVTNAQTGEAVKKNTLFEAGSLTKPIFAFIVMRLVEKGILDLDQTLYDILPFEAVSHDERYKKITVRHVLSHQSGLPNWGHRDDTDHFNLLFAPGTSFGYSGEGYEYLKRVVEKVTDKSISQIIKEEFLIPLELDGFYFESNEQIKLYSARGHFNLQPSDIRLIDKPMMAFSLFTEATSFSKFMLALRNKKGLKKETFDEMLKVQSTREDGVNWGLGFELEDTSFGWSYGHSGSTSSGFICNFVFFPKLDVGYVFFTNSEMGVDLSIPLLTQYLITGKKLI